VVGHHGGWGVTGHQGGAYLVRGGRPGSWEAGGVLWQGGELGGMTSLWLLLH
jgi:hypothetical protein